MSIIDLLTALIKDLKKEISFETLFVDKIFPKIISLIDLGKKDSTGDVEELALLEKIGKHTQI